MVKRIRFARPSHVLVGIVILGMLCMGALYHHSPSSFSGPRTALPKSSLGKQLKWRGWDDVEYMFFL